MKTTLYIVRHGTTSWNVHARLQGRQDIPLNGLGLTQGRLLTDYFKDIPFDLGVTSPLMRARQTLDFMLGARKGAIPIIVEPDIIEIDLGVCDGRLVRECNTIFPEFMDAFTKHPGDAAAPGGETASQVYNRSRDAILKIVKENPGKTIAMATHGFVIQVWLNYCSGIPVTNLKQWVLSNVAVSKFSFDEDGGITADYIGDNHHLPAEYNCNYNWEELTRPVPILFGRAGSGACRRARRFLDEQNIRYLKWDPVKRPLYKEEILSLLSIYGGRPGDILNARSISYINENLREKASRMSLEDAANIIAGNPRLLAHPILAKQDGILFGFDKKKWQRFLNQ